MDKKKAEKAPEGHLKPKADPLPASFSPLYSQTVGLHTFSSGMHKFNDRNKSPYFSKALQCDRIDRLLEPGACTISDVDLFRAVYASPILVNDRSDAIVAITVATPSQSHGVLNEIKSINTLCMLGGENILLLQHLLQPYYSRQLDHSSNLVSFVPTTFFGQQMRNIFWQMSWPDEDRGFIHLFDSLRKAEQISIADAVVSYGTPSGDASAVLTISLRSSVALLKQFLPTDDTLEASNTRFSFDKKDSRMDLLAALHSLNELLRGALVENAVSHSEREKAYSTIFSLLQGFLEWCRKHEKVDQEVTSIIHGSLFTISLLQKENTPLILMADLLCHLSEKSADSTVETVTIRDTLSIFTNEVSKAVSSCSILDPFCVIHDIEKNDYSNDSKHPLYQHLWVDSGRILPVKADLTLPAVATPSTSSAPAFPFIPMRYVDGFVYALLPEGVLSKIGTGYVFGHVFIVFLILFSSSLVLVGFALV